MLQAIEQRVAEFKAAYSDVAKIAIEGLKAADLSDAARLLRDSVDCITPARTGRETIPRTRAPWYNLPA